MTSIGGVLANLIRHPLLTLFFLSALFGPTLFRMASSWRTMPPTISGRVLYVVGGGDEFILTERNEGASIATATPRTYRVALFGVYPPRQRKARLCARRALEAQVEGRDIKCERAAPDYAGRYVATCSATGGAQDVGATLAEGDGPESLKASCFFSLGRYACERENEQAQSVGDAVAWFFSMKEPHIPPPPKKPDGPSSSTDPIEPWKAAPSNGERDAVDCAKS